MTHQPHKQMDNIASDLKLLECTLRDGSYAVDFRFTKEDTAMMCALLYRLGFQYIEIGHGVGINAQNQGKGKMSSSDGQLLAAAKKHARDALIGMFCIPGIASLDHLKTMAQEGLNFVRIGYDANAIEDAFPFVEQARRLNLTVMLNFMKSYAVSPKEFAQKAKMAVETGAQVIYIVDSSGGMLPHEIAEYIDRTKETVDVKIGIHTHNNLQLATANALEAVHRGANFVDTTLYGIGRSAGNVPTEVMVAILNNMGIDVGIDLFELMASAEKYFYPLTERIIKPSMTAVAMGAGRFHSSFYPRVKKVAGEYQVDERRLLFLMGKKDPTKVDEQTLRKTAETLKPASRETPDYDMLSFYSARIRNETISNTMDTLEELINGLVNTAAKGRKSIVIEIIPSDRRDENFILAEYVASNKETVMGRVYFGSPDTLRDIMNIIKGHISFLLIPQAHRTAWIDEEHIEAIALPFIGRERIIPRYNRDDLYRECLKETIKSAAYHFGQESLLIYGMTPQLSSVMTHLSEIIKHIYCYCPRFDVSFEHKNIVMLDNLDDWQDINLSFDLIIYANHPSEEDTQKLFRSLKPSGKILTLLPLMTSRADSPQKNRVLSFDLNHAYLNIIQRWLHFNEVFLGKT